ncbi:MAG TPA: hypothetical protein VEU62_06730 [Bryobacterales bacterium]|nr:hypothetical protein [Bryobacterales bacterium]
MKLVVVGGHSRNIGKTSVAAGIIAATPELRWTALKLTQFGHGLCTSDGEPCECAVQDPKHPFSITKEENRGGAGDTSRFLAAGAAESYWVRTPQGGLASAMPEIRRLIAAHPYVIMESNSVLRFLRPDLYVMVLDGGTADFKPSARENLDRADAFLLLEGPGTEARGQPAWQDVPRGLIERRPLFRVRPPDYFTPDLLPLLRSKLA